MYKQTSEPVKRPWYITVLSLLGVMAVLFIILFIRSLLYGLTAQNPLLLLIDLASLAAAALIICRLVNARCVSYVYELNGESLTLQAILGRRILRELTIKLKDITGITLGRRGFAERYGRGGITVCAGKRILLDPDETLLKLITEASGITPQAAEKK
ncbi:MAG: hypothetical protein PUC05_09205 [Firmicutes bacterium]|nr:hypothetical protein [Bacillota bacterium]